MPMAKVMQILAFLGVTRSIGTVGRIAQAVGKPRMMTQVLLVQLMVLAVLIYPFSARWGILGTSLAVVSASLVARVISASMVIKITRCKIENLCKVLVFPLVNTAIMVLSMILLKKYWATSFGIVQFSISIGLGVLVYLGINYLFDKFRK